MRRVIKCYGCGNLVRESYVYTVYYAARNRKTLRVQICARCYSWAGFAVTSKEKRKAYGLDPVLQGTSHWPKDREGGISSA